MLNATGSRKVPWPDEVLKGIFLTAGTGGVMARTGSSGWGKRAFLRGLDFPERPTAGSVRPGDVVPDGKRGRAGDRADRCLARTGAWHRRDACPDFRSSNEPQCGATARALAVGAEPMLFDESTSPLGPEPVGDVPRVMRSLAREGRRMTMVTREMTFARKVANRRVSPNADVIAEKDRPDQALTAPQPTGCASCSTPARSGASCRRRGTGSR